MRANTYLRGSKLPRQGRRAAIRLGNMFMSASPLAATKGLPEADRLGCRFGSREMPPSECSRRERCAYGQANGAGSRNGSSPQIRALTILALPGAMVNP